jgi:hypothetical protein
MTDETTTNETGEGSLLEHTVALVEARNRSSISKIEDVAARSKRRALS